MEQTPTPQDSKGAKRKRNPWMRALKAVLIVVLSFLLLVIAAVGLAVWILTPDRLTPIVNRIVTEQIDGEFSARRVELTFWSTFPRLKLEVDSAQVVSNSLRCVDEATRRRLPSYADSLLSVGGLSGSIDVASLLIGRISLYDVELMSPKVNIVQVDSVTTNYNIMAPSEEKEVEKALELPDISINRFAIKDGFPIRFVSLADSISVDAELASAEVAGKDAPVYVLNMKGSGGMSAGAFDLPRVPFGLNGSIHWSASEPGSIRAEGLELSADEVALTFDASVRLLDSMLVKELKVTGRNVELSNLIRLVPEKYRGELSKITTNLKMSLTAELLGPYDVTKGRIPPVRLEFSVPRGGFAYEQVQFNGIEVELSGTIDPENPDLSEIDIEKMRAEGKAIDFKLEGRVRRPLSDPDIEGRFEGSVDFARFPSKLTSQLPATLTGTLSGDAKFKLKQSYLSQRGFHKIRLDGSVDLRNFHAKMKDGSGELYTRHTRLELGTSSKVTVNGVAVDSLLTASLTIDTVAASIPGVRLEGAGLTMGVGSRNIASSYDTTRINPIGASIKAHTLQMRSDSDSVSLKLNDAMVKATLQRYQNESRSPLMRLDLDMGRLRMSDRYNRLSLKEVSSSVTLHPKSRPAMSRRMQAVYDSVAALHPGLSSDSLMKLSRRAPGRHRRHVDTKSGGREHIDFQVDNSLRRWLRLWQLEGNLSAKRARLFTPYFPVRNSITNLDLRFTTDSIALRDTRYKLGKSDFTINGTVSNISRALTSRSGRQPLKIELDVRSDTLNINEITRALMMGSAFSERLARGEAKMPDSESDEVMSVAMEKSVGADERSAILIPTNVTAKIGVSAGTMKYGDMLFQRFTGEIEAFDGAVHLSRLGAFTPMGSFGMTALYSAPTKEDIRFAGGIVVRKLDLREFLNMLPEIDSIMPMLRTMEGIITAECAMTTELDTMMNLKFHTLDMALKLSGDSLVLLDSETFRKVSKWLMFKNKKRNMIDSMSVELMIRNNMLQLYPFMVTLDRYKFGISGSNDAALNLNYHIAVLKSPIPFKFGVNIKGTPEHMKIRLGGAKFNEKEVASSRQLTDTVRINLINQIQKMFKFGVRNSRYVELTLKEPKPTPEEFNVADTISSADSLFFIREGVIAKPAGWVDPDSVVKSSAAGKAKSGGKKKKKK